MKHVTLLNKIKEKGGVKVVTIMMEEAHTVFHIDEDFQDDFNVLKWFKKGMEKGASMVIRQQVEEEDFFIAGIVLGNKNYYFLSADEMEWAYTTDSKTGKQIPREPGVTFVTFNELLDVWEYDMEEGEDEDIEITSFAVLSTDEYDENEQAFSAEGEFQFIYKHKKYNAALFYYVYDEENKESPTGKGIQFEEEFLFDIGDREEQMFVFEVLDFILEDEVVSSPFMDPLYERFYEKHGFRHKQDQKNEE